MVTQRSYKAACTVNHARDELQRCAGSQFDPRVIAAFLAILDQPAAEDGWEDDLQLNPKAAAPTAETTS